ncbi:MAG: circularly permuted type 2 ATP-grasp protein [Desulfobacterales bacterium]|jgi:uncharacterized circularly permuted ATP-grasp superfamily protein/uncharacterized alpha-E superfamily protein|nr:circularly permuted type 2 ATP-grasp protein [Desulfobacterales bacterium]
MSESASSQASHLDLAYRPAEGRRDAMWHEGQVRPHWLPYVSAIHAMGTAELQQLQLEIDRLLAENGVSFNVHGDPKDTRRPWRLDPIPLIYDERSWQLLEAGLLQRARLFDLILADLYGPRKLIADGLLPPELLFGDPRFCRPCCGMPEAANRRLFFYAADLTSDPELGLAVLADRTEAPSGVGYAVENRMVMDRLLPDLIRDCRVRRLSTFFRELRAGLEAAAPQAGAAPRVALMTPGPGHGTYFEHAYLAAYLGYPLVQGADLTVRKGRVMLKALDGLKPLDILLRRVDDRLCDPLELQEESTTGVAGLLSAVRRAGVSVANPVGSAVLENPGLPAYLPAIARHLLGEDLRLSSVPTWWCGDPVALDHVQANLENMVVRSLANGPGSAPVHGQLLDRAAQEALRSRMRARPHAFVGQAAVRFATCPAWSGGRFEPHMTVLRCFLAAGRQGYAVLPGGLTLSAASDATLQLSARSGGISKDTWIVAEAPQTHISLWQEPGRSQESAPATTVLPSRIAENLFWVGRYAERAEGITRLLRTIARGYQRSSLLQESADAQTVRILFRAMARLTAAPEAPAAPGADSLRVRMERELLSGVGGPERPANLLATLRFMLRAAHAVRHLWSSDTWRSINRLEGFAESLGVGPQVHIRRLRSLLDEVIISLMAFAGLTSESMTREQGWLLLDIGRRIERSIVLAEFLRGTLVPVHATPVFHLVFEAVLATTENIITYRHRYRNFMQLPTMLEQVLLDGYNPRSLLYQLQRLQSQAARLPRQPAEQRLHRVDRTVLEAVNRLLLADVDELCRAGGDGSRYAALGELLAAVSRLSAEASDELNRTYFSHALRPHQLTSPRLIVDSR